MKEIRRSPCIKECFFDYDSEQCSGCLRTLDEISDWRKMSEEERKLLEVELKKRKKLVKENKNGTDSR